MLKPGGIFICVSYFHDRKEKFLQDDEAYGWEIEIHKVYKPFLEKELELIKKEFVSKSVLEDIKKQKEVDLENFDEFNEDNYEGVEDFEVVKQRYYEIASPKEEVSKIPPDLDKHYVYVCMIPEEKGEEEHIGEEEGSQIKGEEEEQSAVNQSNTEGRMEHERDTEIRLEDSY